MFRYKSPLLAVSDTDPGTDEEYGVGNDIHAYYTVPIGYSFDKRIPVATQDVVEWRKDSGEWPDGIDLDETSGNMTGSPTTVEQETLLYHGYDAGGNRIARAELNFSVFKPVGAGQEIDYYAHSGHYFYEQLPIPAGVDVYRWEPITAFPADVSATGLALQGTPQSAGSYGLAFRGYDFMGREVAFLYGELLVQDGPKVETIGDQSIDLLANESFDVQPVVEHKIGQITYSLVAENGRPQGLQFSASTGALSGAYQTVDTSAKFHVVATDTADGTSSPSNTFKLSTVPASVDLASLGDQQGGVNTPFSLQLSFPGVQAGAKWTLKQGSWPDGIRLDEATGLISGTPTKTQTLAGLVIELSGPSMTTVQSPVFSFRVFPERLTAQLKPLIARTGEGFSTSSPTILTGNVAPISYSIKGSSAGFAKMAAQSLVSLDPATGKVESPGVPAAGTYGVTLIATNGEGQTSGPMVQGIDVYNPQAVAYADGEARRLQAFTLDAVIPDDSVAAPAAFKLLSGSLPDWLSFNSATGRFSGTPIDPSSVASVGPFVVQISDASGEKASSNPFMISVEERDPMTVQLVDGTAERLISNGKIAVAAHNAWKGATWQVQSGSFPTSADVTLAFTADGYLSGVTNDPAGTTYGPFVLEATDADGQSKEVGPFDVTVVEPSELKPLTGSFDAALTWTRGIPFSLDLPALSNAYGAVQYAFSGPEPDLGITAGTGHVGGKIDAAGVTTHPFTVKDATVRTPAGGAITLTMLDPMTVNAEPEYLGNQGATAKFQPVVTNAVGKVTYGPLVGTLPKGLTYSKGVVGGKPERVGTFGPFSFTVTDEPGNTDTATFSVRIDPPLPFSFSYSSGLMTKGLWSNRSPIVVNRIGKVSYKLVSGTLPKGLKLGSSQDYNGHLVGTPSETGRFPDIVISGTDPNYDETSTADELSWTETFDVGVKPYMAAEVPDQTFKVHKDVPTTVTIFSKNVVAPLTFAPKPGTSLPYDLTLDPAAGTLSGTFPEVGKHSGTKVQVVDTFDRKGSGSITFDVIDGVSLTYPDTATFNQFASSSVVGTTANLIGMPTYALDATSSSLPAGLIVNPTTGAIEGTPTVQGDFPGVVVAVTDGFDGSRKTSAPLSVRVEPRLKFALQSPGEVVLKRWQNSTAAVNPINAVGATTFTISPALPTGLVFDQSTGVISGFSAALATEATYSVTATDSRGGSDATTFTLRVDERDALAIQSDSDFTFAQYFAGSFTAAGENVIGTAKWSISPALPSWASFNDGVVSGMSNVKVDAASYVLTLSDDHDTVSKSVSISVGDRKPLQIAEPHVVTAILNAPLSAPLSTTDSVGSAITWSLVSGTLPEGVFFDPAKGSFEGLPTQYGTFPDIVISAADTFGGSVVQTMSIDVKANSTPVTMTIPASKGHAGQDYVGKAPDVVNAIGALTFTATGISGTGLSIDPTTGVIYGVPASIGKINPVVAVEDAAGRKGVAVATIDVLGTLSASVPSTMQLVYNYVPGAANAGVATNAVAPAAWSLASGVLPSGLSVDPASGRLVGKPKQIGEFGPIMLRVTDATGVSADTSPTSMRVEMNGDPISLTVADFSTHVGYPVSTKPPVFDNELGTAAFFSTDASTAGLSLDATTGVLSGQVDHTADAYVNVSIKDSGTSRVTSKPVHLTIVPPQQITAPANVRVVAGDATNLSFLTRQYAVGSASWSAISNAAALPHGLTFNPTTGNLVGTTAALGTYGPFTVTSTDSVGDVQTSNSFQVQVVTGSLYLGLAQGAVPNGVKRDTYASFDFNSLLTAVGVDQSELIWSLGADTSLGQKVPPGLTISNGVLSGTPTLEGAFTFRVRANGGGETAVQTYTMVVTLPQTSLTLAATTLAEAGLKVAYSGDFKNYVAVQNIPTSKLVWTMTAAAGTPTQNLPTGIALGSTTGLFSGTPTKAPVTSDATFTFTVTATFKDGTENLSSSAIFKLPFKTGGVVQAATLGTNSCYLTMVGGVKCAGSGPVGENGSGAVTRVIATDVTGLTSGVAQISSGMIYACALTDGGAVKCWGNNTNGEMGDGTTTQRNTPVDVTGLSSGVAKISAGWAHACALMDDQSIRCWGRNNAGQIGNGTTVNQKAPVPIDVGGPVADVFAGYYNTCALLVDSSVKCWGANTYYQLGNVGTANRTTPFEITGYTGTPKQVTTGSGFTCILTTDGQIQCIGLNVNGRLGDGTTGTLTTPKKTFVTALVSDVKMMDAGITNNCAITNSNGVYCWGDNVYGNVGDATTTDRPTPLRLPQLDGRGWTQIDVNDDHQCASSDQGVGMCWGWGAQGRLGNAVDSAKAYAPVTVVY
jgi:alpha-tubulin suppressor-like RCC1 family protein